MCEIHLSYLGNGIFVQLLPHEEPPKQCPLELDTIPVVIGSFTANESQTLVTLLRERIGIKPHWCKPSTSVPPSVNTESSDNQIQEKDNGSSSYKPTTCITTSNEQSHLGKEPTLKVTLPRLS